METTAAAITISPVAEGVQLLVLPDGDAVTGAYFHLDRLPAVAVLVSLGMSRAPLCHVDCS